MEDQLKITNKMDTKVQRPPDIEPWVPKTFKKAKTPVNQYELSGKFLRTFPSIKDASRALNISPSAISAVCKKMRGSAGNFQWRKA